MSASSFHVAIVGGGLCGIALAIALKKRNVSFTLYESRSSFTEIGAGLNLGPNGLRALQAIEPSLRDKIFALATRNQSPEEDTWMWFKYGAASGDHQDGETFMKIMAPPTGNTTLHRQEFLQALADEMGEEHAKFNKKLLAYEHQDNGVLFKFADGTEGSASILVGCDGIHSRVRTAMLGRDSSLSKAHYNQDGAYRAVIAMEKALEAWGEDARKSQVSLGPNGYFIYYPVSGGKAVNCGAWCRKEGTWDQDEWVLPNQGDQLFREDYNDWGPRIQKMLRLFPEDPSFWAAHQHLRQPESFTDGRTILIGDAAHAMPPHQGAGASQAVEDAYVTAEVLGQLQRDCGSSLTEEAINAALLAIENVRKPRFSKVQEYSTSSGPLWYSFFEQRLEGEALEDWIREVKEQLLEIWDVDIVSEAKIARHILKKKLDKGSTQTSAL
ncbi:FAD NAD(P)-binding domain-containing [Lecanosticta acicola]|uniref:FAD NAD(P)-binding domain-containing n=1 Tax=Lecanosticta acicola TaxID=111012 RepID=A0AAI8YXS1_9PEZI|nr:FAD NAD(P)-binding domain-containing [Lecanosticta acicola]